MRFHKLHSQFFKASFFIYKNNIQAYTVGWFPPKTSNTAAFGSTNDMSLGRDYLFGWPMVDGGVFEKPDPSEIISCYYSFWK